MNLIHKYVSIFYCIVLFILHSNELKMVIKNYLNINTCMKGDQYIPYSIYYFNYQE